MEILLLDTTEKEGEDNTLYHYAQHASTSSNGVGRFSPSSAATGPDNTLWLDLRGVLAAAVGATTSLCGEPLRTAVFSRSDTDRSTGIAGFVNIYEVLYVLVFSNTDVPVSIIEYYTRSSCDLLLSFFGHPDTKLSRWQRRDGGSISLPTLTAQLDAVFQGIFAVIQHDLSFGSHLHFAFDGRVPAVNYPLKTIAKLAAMDVPFGNSTVSSEKYAVIGRGVFYRKQLVFSTMRSDFIQIFFQWLLDGDRFTPDTSATKPPTDTNREDRAPTRFDTYELHDFRFTRHDNYPKRHAFLIVTHGSVRDAMLNTALAFVERKLSLEGKPDAIAWADGLHDAVDQRCIEDIADFCAQRLEAYLDETSALRRQRADALTARYSSQLDQQSEAQSTGAGSSRLMWYSVALDRLRGVIIGDVLTHGNGLVHRVELDQQYSKAVMARFISHLTAFQQSSGCMNAVCTETSPELSSGIPPLKLDVDNPDNLFLREKSSIEAGADISAGDSNIFPRPRWAHEEITKMGRARREVAERVTVRDQTFWIIARYYETLEFFSILDTALPLDLLEHEMNRLCAFGGAEPAELSKDEQVQT